jgi:hypothetical protein
MKKINKITLKIEIDENLDVSYLGEIAETPRNGYDNEAWIPVDEIRHFRNGKKIFRIV